MKHGTIALSVMGIALLAYGLTLSPTINSFDSAEFTTAAYSLGIVHATGYPLYLLLGHALRAIPIGEFALRLNALSAVFAAGAAGLTALTSAKLTGKALPSAAAALLLAFSGAMWSQAVIAEVYTLTALLIAGLALAVLCWLQSGDRWALWAITVLCGLNLTNHLASSLFLPGVLLLCWLHRRDHPPGEWLAAAGFGLLPLSLYAYLPLRYAADPPLNYVGAYFDMPLTSLEGVLWMVSGRMFGQEMFGLPLLKGLRSLLSLLGSLSMDLLGVGVLAAGVGTVVLWRQRREFALFLGMGALGVCVFFSFYDVTDALTMTLPALVALMPFAAAGINRLMERIPPGAVIAVAAVALGASATINGAFANRRGDTTAYDFAAAVFNVVEEDALILTFWTTATPLEYLQIVEGQRPDVDIFDRGLYVLGVRDRLLREGVSDEAVLNAQISRSLLERINEAAAERPVYITENDPFVRGAFCLTPVEGAEVTLYRVTSDPPPGTVCVEEEAP